MKEIWKDIPGYEGLYQASNLGQIKRLSRKYAPKEKVLKPQRRNGYLSICLTKNKDKSTHNIHRLITKTFIGESDLIVNHKDGNKHNNNIENLEYCTSRDNCRHVFTSKIKITNSEKYKTEIINDYQNGVTLTHLTRKYHVDLRDLKILLLRNGFELNEQRTGNYSKVINEQVINKIKNIYVHDPTISNSEISQRTGLSKMTVTRILKIIS